MSWGPGSKQFKKRAAAEKEKSGLLKKIAELEAIAKDAQDGAVKDKTKAKAKKIVKKDDK